MKSTVCVREEAGEREWSYKESLIDDHYVQLQEYTVMATVFCGRSPLNKTLQ